MKRLLALIILGGLASVAYAQTFNLTVAPSSSPSGNCADNACPSSWGNPVFNVTINFDNFSPGHVWTNADVAATWGQIPNSSAWGPTAGGVSPYDQTPVVTVTAGGKSGNGLQVLADDGICGYGNPASPQDFGISTTTQFNVLDVEWDEQWLPGFDLHSMGKMGTAAWFKDPSLPIWYGMQNMWYAWQGSTTQFNLIDLNVGDFGSNPRGATVEDQVSPVNSAGAWIPLSLGTWYHFHFQVALGPNGWYRAWLNGVLYDDWPAKPYGECSSGCGQPISGGPSATDAVSANTLATSSKNIGIQPHFGGQPVNYGLGSGDCMRTNSYIVYDNIHVSAYNR